MPVEVFDRTPNVFEFTICEPPKERFPFDPTYDIDPEKWQWDLRQIKKAGESGNPSTDFSRVLPTLQMLGGKYERALDPKKYQEKARREARYLIRRAGRSDLVNQALLAAYTYPELRDEILSEEDRFFVSAMSIHNIDLLIFKYLCPAGFEQTKNLNFSIAYKMFREAAMDGKQNVQNVLTSAAKVKIVDEDFFKEQSVLKTVLTSLEDRWEHVIPPGYISWPGYLSRIFDLAILSANNINWDGDKVSLDFDREDFAKNAANLPEARSF